MIVKSFKDIIPQSRKVGGRKKELNYDFRAVTSTDYHMELITHTTKSIVDKAMGIARSKYKGFKADRDIVEVDNSLHWIIKEKLTPVIVKISQELYADGKVSIVSHHITSAILEKRGQQWYIIVDVTGVYTQNNG